LAWGAARFVKKYTGTSNDPSRRFLHPASTADRDKRNLAALDHNCG
jgi:hypothetical protein